MTYQISISFSTDKMISGKRGNCIYQIDFDKPLEEVKAMSGNLIGISYKVLEHMKDKIYGRIRDVSIEEVKPVLKN
jgi:hypothetical protein